MAKTDLEMLRHAIATLSYRASKALRDAPEGFADFRPENAVNTPLVILTHMTDLFDWAYTMISGDESYNASEPSDWQSECDRFFTALKKFDDALGSGVKINSELERMFSGPVADALTHTGQLALLRRLYGSSVKGENYSRADIKIGRIGIEQTPPNPKYEFDKW